MKNRGLSPDFLPMSNPEMRKLGWDCLDFLLVSGDAYVDHPSFGVAIVGRVLSSMGFRVGIAAQPDWRSPDSLKAMGKPRLACAVSSGNTDSMLSIYTAARRLRREDDYSPGGKAGLRPPHASAVYAQLARSAFPGLPVIMGGVEASMRRIAHYDYWQDKIRPSILLDGKAELLVYGMAERAISEAATRLASNQSLTGIRGTARLLGAKEAKSFSNDGSFVELPSYDSVLADHALLIDCANICEREANPLCAKKLFQRHGDRILIVEAPQTPLSSKELDDIYDLPFSGLPHPSYKEKIPAFEMIRNSVVSHRGCPGGCSFCGIAMHQGRLVRSRSRESVLREIRRLAGRPFFGGTVSDIGGPTANCYGAGARDEDICARCHRVSCLFPAICPNFNFPENPLLELLEDAMRVKGVSNVFIGSGLRLDLAVRQRRLSSAIIARHVSGHLKVAPEHLDSETLVLMRKNPASDFFKFIQIFEELSQKSGKKQFIVPYFISNFPGSGIGSMESLDQFLDSRKWRLRQVQDFVPLPMTMAAAMYCSGLSQEGGKIEVNRGLSSRRPQMEILKKKR